jgi:hypothetical protein
MSTRAWFAHMTDRGFVHVMPSRMAVEMCGPGEIVGVEVSEDPEGDYWAWEDAGTGRLSFVFRSLVQLDVCFPDFTEGAMRRGAGRRLRVRVVSR